MIHKHSPLLVWFRIPVAMILVSAAATSLAQQRESSGWSTTYENSGYRQTPRYAETIAYCRKMAAASAWVKYTSFGFSAQGRELPLVILSKDRAFDPASAAKTRKAVILMQSGIHAGEIDGKDASLMLMRDIAVTRKYATLLDNTILLFVPIFNVDGHERFGPFNRINQNGPEEMGWRVTSQNLNLNRDYMKADTPEMRAMLTLFSSWLPDFYVDCHVTDGIDFQYDVTYAVETAQNIDPALSSWTQEKLLPGMIQKVEAAGHKIFFYVFPREDNDLGKGLGGGVAKPRFSTGYGGLQNRPTLLIETHMLKPYRTRVDATYLVLKAVLETINSAPQNLRAAVRTADSKTVDRGMRYDPRQNLPLRFDLGDRNKMMKFLGIKAKTERSEISGGFVRIYTGEPEEMSVPFFDEAIVTDSVSIPVAYLVPQEWSFVPEVMRVHGIDLERLQRSVTAEVQSYRFTDVKWPDHPYEGRQCPTYTMQSIKEMRTYPKGTLCIRMNQRAAKVAMHLLEPKSPDSFVAWGFFNAIFEQKEYAESYVMEQTARAMLASDPALKREFEEKVRRDSVFARSPDDRLNWLYLRSPWADPWLNKYPVGRLVSDAHLKTEGAR